VRAVAKKRAAAQSLALAIALHGSLAGIFFMNAAADLSPRSIIPGATQLTAISGARALPSLGQHVYRCLDEQ